MLSSQGIYSKLDADTMVVITGRDGETLQRCEDEP